MATVGSSREGGRVEFPHGRARRLIDRARRQFALDLHDLVVYTEAASGWFALTPLIAALAGAARVIAQGRDSEYGSFDDVRRRLEGLAERWGVRDRLRVVEKRTRADVEDADIVTNLGFVRPIDASTIAHLKPTAVIPLMWEPWEFRPGDVDLDACAERGIAVLGTDERVPELRTFDFVGMLAVRLLLERDIEGLMSTIAVLGTGLFGDAVVRQLRRLGADVRRVSLDESTETIDGVLPDRDVPTLGTAESRAFLASADAIVIAEHHSHLELVGPNAAVGFDTLYRDNPTLVVVHICGNVDRRQLAESGLSFHPPRVADVGAMSVTTAYLGPRPLIDLHTAGLRVGEVLTRERRKGVSVEGAVATALATTPARDFDAAQPA